jgi:hypothetical protein
VRDGRKLVKVKLAMLDMYVWNKSLGPEGSTKEGKGSDNRRSTKSFCRLVNAGHTPGGRKDTQQHAKKAGDREGACIQVTFDSSVATVRQPCVKTGTNCTSLKARGKAR